MRARKLNRPGRILVYFLSFLMAFSGASTFCIQAVQAATQTIGLKGEEPLHGMLSVGSVVDEGWEVDSGLKDLLTQRDLEATEFTKENEIFSTYTKSEEFGRADDLGVWLGNVMYEGSVLRKNSFDGFNAIYDDADSAVIKAGINRIGVTLSPIGDVTVKDEGGETDFDTWTKQYGFASRFMLPHWNEGDGEITLKDGFGYSTTLFIVGLSDGSGAGNRIYAAPQMSYIDYLSYVGSAPSDANLLAYLSYIDAYNNTQKKRQDSERAVEQWLEWLRNTSDSKSSSGHSHHDDKDRGKSKGSSPKRDEPETSASDRVVMIYMDAADMKDDAVKNIEDMLKGSVYGNGLSDRTRVYIITGGSKGTSVEVANYTGDDSNFLFGGENGNQLWRIDDGKLVSVPISVITDNNGNPVTDMTDRRVLEQFIKDVREYDDDRFNYDKRDTLYDLIMWSHAGGPETGFGKDTRNDDPDKSMSVADMIKAFENAGVPFDFIAFDSCDMANAEIALALAPYADYLLGAEGKMPESGLAYLYLIRLLAENPSIKTCITGADGKIDAGLVAYIVDQCVAQYSGENPRKEIAYSVTDLVAISHSNDEFVKGLKDLSSAIYTKITDAKTGKDARYALLEYRKKFSAEENHFGYAANDLVDLYTFCEGLAELDPAYREACDAIREALKDSTYAKTVYDSGDSGTVPNGLSIYFPSDWRTVYTENGKGVPNQIEALLKVYENIEDNNGAIGDYKRAIAVYGLWLKTGELMRSRWDDTRYQNRDLYVAAVKSGLEADCEALIEHIKASEPTDEDAAVLVNKIIEQQISDAIQKGDITVETIVRNDSQTEGESETEKKLTIDDVNPDFVDRVEVKITVKDVVDKKDGTRIGDVSLGYDNYYADRDEKASDSDTVVYELSQFDNQWLTLNGIVASYFDTTDPDKNAGEARQGVIPVAYWYGKDPAGDEKVAEDGYISLQDAVANGYLMLGVFEVTFDDEGNGVIKGFRVLSDDGIKGTSYEVNDGEKYELLGNFDNTGTDYSNLVSLGLYEVEVDSNKDNRTTGFATVADLEAEYRIVDAFESRYELNEKNFGSNDPRNLDDFQEEDKDSDPGIQVRASRRIEIQRYTEVPDESKQGKDKGAAGSDSGEVADNAGAEGARVPADTGMTDSDIVSDTAASAVPVAAEEAPAAATDPVQAAAAPAAADPSSAASDPSDPAAILAAAGVPSSGDPEVDAQAAQIIAAATPGTEDTGANGVEGTVPGMEITVVNPVTGEAISASDTSITNPEGGDDVSTEYVTPGLSDDQNYSVSESESSGGDDKGSGDSGGDSDGGDDGGDSDSSSDDGGSDDSGSEDSGSDSGEAE